MGTSRRQTSLLLAALLLLGAARPLPARADAPLPPPAVEEHEQGGEYVVDGVFEAPGSAETVWQVLTDYDHIGEFVQSMKKSVVRERREKTVVVEQEAVAHVLFLTRRVRVLLSLDEDRPRGIVFHELSGRDFERYQGTWTLTESGGRTRVAYHLEATPRTGVPSFIGASVFRASAAQLLGEVQAEVARRAQEIAGK